MKDLISRGWLIMEFDMNDLKCIVKEETYTEYIKGLIHNGYYDKELKPLKCESCGSTEFKHTNIYHDEVWGGVFESEYTIECTCGEKVGYWAYGNYSLE